MSKTDNQKHSEPPPWDILLTHARIATMADKEGFGIIADGALGVKSGKIAWVGPMESLPGAPEQLSPDVVDCGHAWLTPGLIDCRAQLLYIPAAAEEPSLARSIRWMVSLLQQGVTTIGRLSAKGTNEADEVKLQEAVKRLEKEYPVRIATINPGTQLFPKAELNEKDARALASSGRVAVLLPGSYYMGVTLQQPPVAMLREHHVPVALATNAKPLEAPFSSLLMLLNMGVMLFGLTPEEVFRGVTINAAKALGLESEVGSLEAGKAADLALWEIAHPAELSYHLGYNPCLGAFKGGQLHRVKEYS